MAYVGSGFRLRAERYGQTSTKAPQDELGGESGQPDSDVGNYGHAA
jgi:hypothetical protein